MKGDFLSYLAEYHSERCGLLDDDQPDAFNDLLGEMDVDDVIKHAESWGIQRYQLGYVHASNEALRTIRRHS